MADVTHQQTPTPRPRDRDGSDPSRDLWDLWRRGEQPRVEDFLAQAGVRNLEQVVMALRVDQAERARLGQWVPAEDYLDAFPAIKEDAGWAVNLIFAEYLLREERGEQPPLEEFLRRFPSHAGELTLQIELHRALEAGGALTADGAGGSTTLPVGGGSRPADQTTAYPDVRGYEVLGVLGRGGIGVVYRAWQIELRRQVALKMLHAGALANPESLARFRVEAEAVARLHHANIVQIHGVGEHAGAPFLVLELVEGRSLAQTLAGTPQPADRAAGMIETLARAVHSAHLMGVVHRNLSPANVLVTAGGTPKITDFGLAKLIIGGGSLRTATGELLGTPSYMAPEQAGSRDGQIGPATDVYALGAILYELLTGRPPFKAEQPMETIRQVLTDEPVAPSRLRPRLPRNLETICLKCLRKELSRRYDTAEALAEELRRFLERRPIKTRRSTLAERSWRWCRRNPWPAAAAVLLTFVAIGSSIAAWKSNRDRLRIRRAERETRVNLLESLVAQAQAQRLSHRAGQRFESLDALDRAIAIARELKLSPDHFDLLRDEVIACMALPDLRETGRVIHRPPRVLLVTFDPAMTRYALRFRDGTITVCRVADDAEVDRFRARGDRDIAVFRFSPDGRYLATTHFPGLALRVRDVDRRKFALDAPGPVAGSAARLSPDGRRIALCRLDGTTLIYDLATGRQGGSWPGPASGNDLAYSADGARIATLHNERARFTCRIVESETGRPVRSIDLPSDGVWVAWGPDGTTLATACIDAKVYLWDVATGRRKAVLEGSTNAGLIATFHSSGALVASNGWENRLRLWDPILGRTVLSLTTNGFLGTEFSRDGRIIAMHDDDVTTYEVDPALDYRTFAHAFGELTTYWSASIRRDGRVLAVGTQGGVALWDLARGTELPFLPTGRSTHVLFEASGDLLTLNRGPRGVRRWPVRLDPDRGEFRIGPPRRLPLPAGGLGGLAEDVSGRIVAGAEFRVAHVRTPDRSFHVAPLDDCRYVAVSPDGQWLATGSHVQNGAQVWRIADGEQVKDLKEVEGIVKVAFSPDGKWLMTSASPCRLWAVGTWNEVLRVRGDGYGFSPDGRFLLVLDAKRILHLVEPETGRTVARLESPDLCGVICAAFSTDGSRLAVVTNDGPAVHVWDLRAIRKRLAVRDLDWDAPPYPAVDQAEPSAPPLPPLQVELDPLDGHVEQLGQSPEELIAVHTQRIGKGSDDAESYHQRGHALVRLRRFPESLDDFNRALSLRPGDVHLRIVRAAVQQVLNRYEPAIADLDGLLAERPDLPGVRDLLARCCNNRAWELTTGPGSTRDAGARCCSPAAPRSWPRTSRCTSIRSASPSIARAGTPSRSRPSSAAWPPAAAGSTPSTSSSWPWRTIGWPIARRRAAASTAPCDG